jgi:hypothetical protein
METEHMARRATMVKQAVEKDERVALLDFPNPFPRFSSPCSRSVSNRLIRFISLLGLIHDCAPQNEFIEFHPAKMFSIGPGAASWSFVTIVVIDRTSPNNLR